MCVGLLNVLLNVSLRWMGALLDDLVMIYGSQMFRLLVCAKRHP